MRAESRVFGPVPSRRLGRSLGVDLVRLKTCTFDCVFCQLGRTTEKTVERREYVPTGEVLEELAQKLSSAPPPDYVTLSGSGEPTLSEGLGRAIREARRLSSAPVAVLTNGSLLGDPEVRRELSAADLVKPSLSAGTEEAFRRVNRPHESIEFDEYVEGLARFREEYKGRIWLEFFVVPGANDSPEELAAFGRHLRRIRPDRLHLNTAVRPPADADCRAATPVELQSLAGRFGGAAEVIADFPRNEVPGGRATEVSVLEMLRRRPCTLEDISSGLGAHPAEVLKYVDSLLRSGRIELSRREGRAYYRVAG